MSTTITVDKSTLDDLLSTFARLAAALQGDSVEPQACNAEPPAYGYADVSGRVISVVQKCGRESAVALLAGFGVDHGTKLKPEQYSLFIEQADALLAKETT